MIKLIKDRTLRFILTWTGNIDLDLNAIFPLSNNNICHVFYGNTECLGVKYSKDSKTGSLENNGIEIIDINILGSYQYTIYVTLYGVFSNQPLYQSKANLSLYTANFQEPVFSIDINNSIGLSTNKQSWVGVCFDGATGFSTLRKINEFVDFEPKYNFCDKYLQLSPN